MLYLVQRLRSLKNNMNWKVVCLIAGLTLTAGLTSCSGTDARNNQVSPSTAPTTGTTETNSSGEAMMQKDDAMMKTDGQAMMKKGEAMMKEPTTTKP
jgi:hypothetical protein